ncbi:MAG TPA: hypothetical protein VHE54_09065 [Puia sp.]|nr:hypothetical protein [Puia sp.]
MKKIALIVNLLFVFVGLGLAQTQPASAKDARKARTAASVQTAKPATTAKTTAPGPLKKDGTADMRYKANKDAAKTPPQHLKKDGTPDMRYKENKAGAKAPPRIRKDGRKDGAHK